MSKMSQLQMELTEQANELGFATVEEALAKGYEVDYENYKLVKRKLGWSETVEYLAKEQEKAHEAWLKEREIVVGGLTNLLIHKVFDFDIIEHAIKFIKEGEH